MDVFVSPYHLTTGEPCAMAALLIASRVVTWMPAPFGVLSRAGIKAAVEKSPGYLRMMESWRWSMPMWREGVIVSAWEGSDLSGVLGGVMDRMAREESAAPLRMFLHREMMRTERAFLDRVCGDVLRGGPDPGVNIPVNAAADAFALGHGLVVARTGAASVARRIEDRVAREVFSVAAPVYVRASSERLLRARARLSEERERLNAAMDACFAASERGADEATRRALVAGARRAAEVYAGAFARAESGLEGAAERGEVKAVSRFVTLTGVMLPVDVVVRSGAAAARSVGGAKKGSTRRVGAAAVGAAKGAEVGEGDARGGEAGMVRSLIVREMKIQPAAEANES